jgi:hypothetical protein
MTISSPYGAAGPPSSVTALPGVAPPGNVALPAGPPVTHADLRGSRGSPESRYMYGPGKLVCRQLGGLHSQRAEAAAREKEGKRAAEQAEHSDRKLKESHRGGDRPWLLRLVIPLGMLAEAVTAYVGMEAIVTSRPLAVGLSALTAVIGGGMACALANCRLNQLPVPGTARLLEGIFVAVLTVLRFESLHIQTAGLLAPVAGSVLAAIISALGLLGIEEIVVETRTLGIFLSGLWANWKRSRSAAGTARLGRIQARIDDAAGRLHQQFLEFLLKTEEFPLDEARQRAAALSTALTDRGV